MSDCEKCMETPCSCGYSYKDETIEYLIKMRNMFQNLIDVKALNESAQKKLDYLTSNDKWFFKDKLPTDNKISVSDEIYISDYFIRF